MILQLSIQILKGDQEAPLILADYLEENFSSHKEYSRYSTYLRQPNSLRVGTIIDCVAKFGSKSERRKFGKIIRGYLRGRRNKKPEMCSLRNCIILESSYFCNQLVEQCLLQLT